jgi:hypothetical protein
MPKGVIVVLVVIAVVFVLTLVLGHRKHGQSFSQGDQPPGIVTAFKGGGSPLTIEDPVTTTCGSNSPTRVTVSGACTITVPSRSAFASPKRVALAPASGNTFVRIVPADGDAQGPKSIPGDKACLASAVDHKGAVIQLACAGGGTCVVDLVRSC